MNLPTLAERFQAAVAVMEQRWAMLRVDRFDAHLLARYVRALRRCQRLREELSHLMETGKL